MKKLKNTLLPMILLVVIIAMSSCKNVDDGVTTVPERDRAEQQAEDRDTLLAYLGSHYYNSDDFVGNMNPTINELVITELPEGETLPDGHTLLIDAVETHNTVLLEVDYEFYILKLNQGGGSKTPNFPDDVRVNYAGNLLDGTVFDSSVNSVVFDLTSLVPGWSRVLPEFNDAESFILNSDGTVNFNNAGVGAMFIPSGLGYFSGGASGIPVYSSLVFKFELYQTAINDHDFDGIPSWVEDLDEDLDLSNDDTDDNGLANFVSVDDDGDGVLTNDELEHIQYTVDTNMGEEEPILMAGEYEVDRTTVDGIITINTVKIVDANNDGTPDYLDDAIDTNNNPDED
ncbi:MAG: FKBP-type peptidyl-prolyl cis-trans isomerase [Bacteroidia bacterium]|nr:FKBP-type peptidyl-prolyl cis-trans isomerase [Bacteroidia bacterium]NND26946.1 hypothetical protein [Flavobacteriaceae bacterium]NNK60355.1 hypothetical protein [Flavobacteriaceae bacterium]RZW56318.1 MAG: hypothetical protein EX263_02480 [Flavobacteriaceae bacterium]